jgi:hypothetical protein
VCLVLVLVLVRASVGWGMRACSYGGSEPLAVVNGGGEMLVAWTEVTSGAHEWEEEKVCGSRVAPVAVGSPEKGFKYLGPVSEPSGMSYPTGVAIDAAGDGWVVGSHGAVTGSSQYGLDWAATSAWVAFRPAGGGLRRAVKLPSRGVLSGEPRVAENSAGVTLFVWGTERGAYLAWGDPEGRISRPSFIGHGLKVAAIGVDEHGEALVIGYYIRHPRLENAVSSIVSVTAHAYGAFSRPRVIVAESHDARGQVTTEFEEPVATVGPTGAAVVIWDTWQQLTYGPSRIIYRYPDGRFTHPQRIAKHFLGSGETFPATIDAAGRALILHEAGRGLREVTVMPSGRLGAERTLPKVRVDPALAGNERGETVIGFGEHNELLSLFGDTLGAAPTSELFQTPDSISGGPAVTIDASGQAAAVWMEKPTEAVTLVNARAIAPGAQTVQIARGELKL